MYLPYLIKRLKRVKARAAASAAAARNGRPQAEHVPMPRTAEAAAMANTRPPKAPEAVDMPFARPDAEGTHSVDVTPPMAATLQPSASDTAARSRRKQLRRTLLLGEILQKKY